MSPYCTRSLIYPAKFQTGNLDRWFYVGMITKKESDGSRGNSTFEAVSLKT